MDNPSLVILSDLIRSIGLAYLAGVVISASGIFPSFGESLGSKIKAVSASPQARRQGLSSDAPNPPKAEFTAKTKAILLIVTAGLIALAYFGFKWIETAQIPALSLTFGLVCFAMALFNRRQFLRDWTQRTLKFDLASILITVFFLFILAM